MKKEALLLLALLLMQSAIFASAGENTIKGKVINKENSQPIEYATAVLLSLPDSATVKSALTNNNGEYHFEGVANGKYAIRTQFVGFTPIVSGAIEVKGDTEIPAILLAPSARIKELTVSGKKPYIEKKADRTVLNIAESATASGENAFEVLKKAPNVNIDKDDNININGKQGVLITINDRPTQLSGTNLANYLRSMQGSEIDKIEIINTPPARYDAEGNTGVINIKVKKNTKIGFNGSLNADLGRTTDYWTESGGINLNFRRNKTNVYASYNAGRYPGNTRVDIDRMVTTPANKWLMIQRNNDKNKYTGNSLRTGIDYYLNKRNTFGVMINAGDNKFDETYAGSTKFVNSSNLTDSSIVNYNPSGGTYKNINYNVNYKLDIDTTGTSLNIDLDYGNYDNNKYSSNLTDYFNAAGTTSHPQLMLQSWSPADIEIKSGKADFVKPFANKMRLEAGVKASAVETDNDLRCEKRLNGIWGPDNSRSNHFIYDEKILAAYASLQGEFKSTSIKGGLRIEHTSSKGNSITANRIDKRSYTDLFPSLFIQQKLNDKNMVGLSYNRRIDRPKYQDLNPFRIYMDEYTYMEGNPFLKPQYTNNVSLNYAWKNMFFSEVSYSHTSDVMTSLIILDENSVSGKQTTQNMNSLNSFTWNNSLNINPTKWYANNTNVSVYYNEYNRETSSSTDQNSKLTASVYMNNTFILPKKYTIEVSGWYQSSSAYGMFKVRPRYSVGIGFQKVFLKDKARVKLSVDDIFDTQKNKFTADYDNLNMLAINKWQSRKVSLSFSYRFGQNDNRSARQRGTSSEDESNRVSTGN